MNAYLSREEKEHFVRATLLSSVLEGLITGYAKAKSTNPDFLKFMRMSRTFLQKALIMRSDALDQDSKVEFYKQCDRIEPYFLLKPEAKKALAELVKLQTTIPMDINDFEDWYSSVIETTCKYCVSKEYPGCPIRRVLTKYGVYPVDPEAKDKCQFSYVGTTEADIPETVYESVSPDKYNAVVTEYNLLEAKVRETYLPAIEALQLKIEQLETAAAAVEQAKAPEPEPESQPEPVPDGKTGLLPAVFGLISGSKLELQLPEHMAKNLLTEMNRPGRNNRALCACQAGDQLIAVDMAEIITMVISGVGAWSRTGQQPAAPVDQERVRYKIECKCGAEYFCSMNAGRTKARCRDCNDTLFLDPNPNPRISGGVQFMTNRYWVDRPETPVPQKYADPCDPFK